MIRGALFLTLSICSSAAWCQQLDDCGKLVADRLPVAERAGHAGKRLLQACEKNNGRKAAKVAVENAIDHDAKVAERADLVRACVAGARVQSPDDNIAGIVDACIASTDPVTIQAAETAKRSAETEAWEKAEREFQTRQAIVQKEAADWAARPKSVRIGMSAKEVTNTQWGRPNRVNSSVGSYGRHEQWVYGDGNYLYFENGVLTSIHTSRSR